MKRETNRCGEVEDITLEMNRPENEGKYWTGKLIFACLFVVFVGGIFFSFQYGLFNYYFRAFPEAIAIAQTGLILFMFASYHILITELLETLFNVQIKGKKKGEKTTR